MTTWQLPVYVIYQQTYGQVIQTRCYSSCKIQYLRSHEVQDQLHPLKAARNYTNRHGTWTTVILEASRDNLRDGSYNFYLLIQLQATTELSKAASDMFDVAPPSSLCAICIKIRSTETDSWRLLLSRRNVAPNEWTRLFCRFKSFPLKMKALAVIKETIKCYKETS